MSDIFVVGSLHYDIVMRAPHLPAIDETVMGESVQYVCGGKGGNQAVSASRNGGNVAFAGAVGPDTAAETLLANLDAAEVDIEQIQRMPAASGMSVAIVDERGDYGAVVASGANQLIDAALITVPEGTACIVLQNEVPEPVNVAAAAQAKNAKVVLNAAPMRPLSCELLGLVDILIVNRVEAESFFGVPIALSSDARRALDESNLPVPCVVITLGADGLVYREHDSEARDIAALNVETISSHGAGDAFVGAFAVKLASGATLADAVEYASAAAALWVSTPEGKRAALDQNAVARFLAQSLQSKA